MSIIQCVTTSFSKQILEGEHDFKLVGGDTFKIALYQDTANLDGTTTAYTSTGEITATGYTTGGATLTCIAPASAGFTGYCSFQTVSWSASAITAMGALIYNSSGVTYPNASVMVLSFGTNRGSDSSGNFVITFPTNNSTSAILRINAPSIA